MKSIHDNYITIQGWMVTALNLKGSDLQLFALIHGFCQDRKSRFSGSLSYLEMWLNTSRPTVIAAINRLMSAGWITTHVGNINQVNEYSVNWKAVDKAKEVVKKFNQGSKETLPEVVKKFNQGSKETLPNIYSNTDNENIERDPALENSTFHVQVHSLETLPDPPASDPAPSAHFDTPDWMEVARQMYEYSRGEGKAQYDFLANTMRFHGDPMPIFANWAGKASPYQLRTWKKEFPKLGMWFRNEAQRPNNSPAAALAIEQPKIRREL